MTHIIENALAPYLGGTTQLDKAYVDGLRRLVDIIREEAGTEAVAVPAEEPIGVGSKTAGPEPPRALPILVVDDSRSTRAFEQSLLEGAGYEVDVAASAQEAIEKAHQRRYGLFVVDVEMPGMNGFEFTAATRADSMLRTVPVVLVTSLSSPEYRRHGLEVGASALIVKSKFDRAEFVRVVADLSVRA
jgi:two-component system chemotaxis sensor kinase CheA